MSIRCLDCNRDFANIRAYAGHRAYCGKKDLTKKCSVCNKKISIYSFKKHMETHKKDSSCPNCHKIVFGRKEFCNSSCAATYNNKHQPKVRIKCTNPNCNKLIPHSKKSKSKYCSKECSSNHIWLMTKIKIENGGKVTQSTLKKYILEKRGHKCEICGGTEWMEKPIPLILDHIDGNSEHNSPSNVRLVCGNCDMQLPTYKSKNKGSGRAFRRKRYAEGKSY